jgi:hypothetical protein
MYGVYITYIIDKARYMANLQLIKPVCRYPVINALLQAGQGD